jgi:CHAT domain-containing protein/Tfp pilus assembly protein PilF
MIQESGNHQASYRQHWQVVHQNSANILMHCALFLLFSLSAVAPPHQAFGRHLGLHQQPTKASSEKVDKQDVRPLEAGQPIRRELAGGQQHSYQIRLSADQFLKVAVEQDGIDVSVQVLGPDGKQIMEFNSEIRTRGQESVSLVAEAAGDHLLTVRSRQKAAPPGGYDILIEELRAATEDDRALYKAQGLYREAIGLIRLSKYDEAIRLTEQLLAIRERILGTEHRDVAAAINMLAVNYWRKGDYTKAEPLYERALAIVEKVLGPEHPRVAATLDNLAVLYDVKGSYERAEPLHRRALAIQEKALGPEHPDVAVYINNLAIFYNIRCDYDKAEPLFQRSLAIAEKVLGPEHPEVARPLNNLANLYSDKGDYAKAELFYRRALTIWEKALGPEHPEVANTLNNLALLYSDRGEYGKAEPLYGRALAIQEKVLGPEHPEVARVINNFAPLYHLRGDYKKAEALNRRALAIQEKSLGPEHPEIAFSLNNLADLYWMRGDFVKAQSLLQRGLALREKAFGPEHRTVADSLYNLVRLYFAKGDAAQALIFQSRHNAIAERNLALNLAIGSERQKLAYLAALSEQTDRTVSLHIRYLPNNPLARDLAATIILQRKGRALDATSQNLNALRSRFNEEDRVSLDRLTETRSQLAKLVLDGPQGARLEQHRSRIKTLEDQAEQYEADISHRSNEFRAQSLPITLASVRAAIPADAALIEFASYRPLKAKAIKDDEAYGQPRYVAYVLRRRGEIQWKELGEVKIIDRAITALRNALRSPKRADVKSLARAVDQKVFKPLRPLVGESTQLLISPDGMLNLVPFAALVDERGRYLVERYSISYLASGRDLLRLQVIRESQSAPLVVAAPDFGSRSQVEATHMENRKKGAPKGDPQEKAKDEAATSAFNQFYFSPLPYTMQEGDALRALLSGVTLLTKREASKAALSQVRSPALLHIATHGFFLKDLKSTAVDGRGFQTASDDPQRLLRELERSGVRIENPLLRSGLALAGANERNPDDNGILTALEVTGLNLWGTKLVVLSACDTGVGEVKNGDGVHGLRRALVLAGSESQVMSLWAVSDKGTRELMVSYYRMLQQGKGRGEGLRQVQLEMLKRVNRRHPYYWASFIQSGEWANLDGKR